MITWRENMSVGVPAIDDSQRSLITTINDFGACQMLSTAKQAAKTLLEQAHDHFDQEEQFLEMASFPDRFWHKADHASIEWDICSIIHELVSYEGEVTNSTISEMYFAINVLFTKHATTHTRMVRKFLMSSAASSVNRISHRPILSAGSAQI
jgi:hemerythrin-like metal-binding protein